MQPVNTFAKIEEGVKGAISFLANPKYIHYLYDTKSTIVLVDEPDRNRETRAYHYHKSCKCT